MTTSKKMKSLVPLLLTLGLISHMGDTVADTLTDEEYAAAEEYIRDCAKDWAESVVTGDYSRRKIYFAEDFYGTDIRGGRYKKAEKVKETGPSEVYVSNTINDIEVRFFGDTAIAYGDETWVKKNGDTGRWVWTDVWVFRNGNWQIVAAQDVEAPVASE